LRADQLRGVAEVVIVIGLPASGKSTFGRERFGAHALVSKDLMPRSARDKGERQAREIEQALGAGGSVLVDNTNPRVEDRAPLIAMARRFGARAIGYFFPPDVSASLYRNERRAPKVPKVAIFLARKRMQPPSLAEGFDELYEVRLSERGFEVRRVGG
jgi:predicted kinase